MDIKSVRVFLDEEDFNKANNELLDGELSIIGLDIDVIDLAIHVEYIYDGEVEILRFHRRHFFENYEYPDFEVHIQSIDDLEEMPEAIYDVIHDYYVAAHNINITLLENEMYDHIIEDEELLEYGGIGIICHETDDIVCFPVSRKDRPLLLCINPSGDEELCRPYHDEVDEHIDALFEDIDTKEERADNGNINDIRDLAFRYLIGIQVEADPKKAMHYAKILIDNNIPFGNFVAAILYCLGHGVRKNYKKAIQLVENYEDDEYCGDLYDIIQNMDELYKYHKTDAYSLLGYMTDLLDFHLYLHDELSMPFQSRELTRLAKQMVKENIPQGHFFLGRVEEAKGNLYNAVENYKLGEKNNCPRSMTKLAFLHLDGVGVRKNRKKAVSLFKKAAKLGFIEAYRFLGEYYLSEDNPMEAVKYFNKYQEDADDPIIQDLIDQINANKPMYN